MQSRRTEQSVRCRHPSQPDVDKPHRRTGQQKQSKAVSAADLNTVYIIGDVNVKVGSDYKYIGWNIDNAVAINATDGAATVEIRYDKTTADFSIYTATPDEVKNPPEGKNSWNVINGSKISPESFGATLYGKTQDVLPTANNVKLPMLGEWTLSFSDNFKKVDVTTTSWEGKLFCVGVSQNINGQQMGGWNINSPVEVVAENGYFTLECPTLKPMSIGCKNPKGNWGTLSSNSIGSSVWESRNGHNYVPLTAINKACVAKLGIADVCPPYEGQYLIKIKDDLSEITYEADYRNISICGTFNDFQTDHGMWEMSTTDGITYTFTCDETHKIAAGEKIRLVAQNNWRSSWMLYAEGSKEGGDVVIGDAPQQWGYQGEGQRDGSLFVNDYDGTITAVIPAADPYDGGYEKTTATVTCKPGTQSGADNIVTEEDNAPVIYYNLQGIEVIEPQSGLYIKRQGSKTTKVIL